IPKLDSHQEVKSRDYQLLKTLHFTIKEVTYDLEHFQFNTAISRLMELLNAIYSYVKIPDKVDKGFLKEILKTFVLILTPFAPHMAEELWEKLGEEGFAINQPWPSYDMEILKTDTVVIPIQVNGKLADTISVSANAPEEEIVKIALNSLKVKRILNERTIKKTIYIPNRVINIVT
ncbi:MAG: class I tRNA ligase family protein, partial [bacterium]